MYPNSSPVYAPPSAPAQPAGPGGVIYGQAPWHDPNAAERWRNAQDAGGAPDPRLMAASYRHGSPAHQAVLERLAAEDGQPALSEGQSMPPAAPQAPYAPPPPSQYAAPAQPSGYDAPAFGVMERDFTEAGYGGHGDQFGVAPAPSGAALWRGMPKGTAVGLWQRFLMHQGISVGPHGEDGDFGSATERGTRTFQETNGLQPTGWVGEADFEKAVALGYGPGLPRITPSQIQFQPQAPAPSSSPTAPWATSAAPSGENRGIFKTAIAVSLGVIGALLIWLGLR